LTNLSRELKITFTIINDILPNKSAKMTAIICAAENYFKIITFS